MTSAYFSRILQHGFVQVPPDLLFLYKKLGLSREELLLILMLLAQDQTRSYHFPDMQEMGDLLEMPPSDVQETIALLVEKGFLGFDSVLSPETGEKKTCFSTAPLFEKLGILMLSEMPEPQVDPSLEAAPEAKDDGEAFTKDGLYCMYEQAFGRLLSPMEAGYLEEWEHGDGFSRDMIREALRIAMEREKRNFKYIDAILRNWREKGIQTLADVENEKKSRQQVRISEKAEEKKARDKKVLGITGSYDELVMN